MLVYYFLLVSNRSCYHPLVSPFGTPFGMMNIVNSQLAAALISRSYEEAAIYRHCSYTGVLRSCWKARFCRDFGIVAVPLH